MNRRRLQTAPLLALLAHLLYWLASPAPARAESSAMSVEVTLVGRAAQEPELGARIASWFDDERFHVDVRRTAELDPESVLAAEPEPGLRIWVQLKSDQLARLYFVTVGSEQRSTYLLREIGLERGLDELGAERVATVLHLSSMALLEGQAATARAEVEASLNASAQSPSSAAPEVAPPAPPEARQAPAKGRALTPVLGVGYGLAFRGDEGLGHGPRLTVGVETRRLSLRLIAHSALPHTERLEPIDLRLYALGASLVAGAHHTFGERWRFEGYGGAGGEHVRYEPRRGANGTAPLAAAGELRAHLLWGVSLGVELERVELLLAVECAVQLQDTHYDLRNERGTQELGGPGWVLPGATLELRL